MLRLHGNYWAGSARWFSQIWCVICFINEKFDQNTVLSINLCTVCGWFYTTIQLSHCDRLDDPLKAQNICLALYG